MRRACPNRSAALLRPPLQDALGGAVQIAVRLFASEKAASNG